MRKPLLIASLLLPLDTLAQTLAPPAPTPGYKFAFGVLGTYQAVGLQSELRVSKSFGFKAVGARSFDYGRPGEHGGAGIGMLTYYLPTKHPFLEPLLGLGGIYSWYHWDLNGTSGTIRDLNVGGAFGTNFRFSNRFRSGVNVFVGNGFRADYVAGEMSIVGRRLLVLPTLTLDLLL